jgi:hypothetical protein
MVNNKWVKIILGIERIVVGLNVGDIKFIPVDPIASKIFIRSTLLFWKDTPLPILDLTMNIKITWRAVRLAPARQGMEIPDTCPLLCIKIYGWKKYMVKKPDMGIEFDIQTIVNL